MIDQSISACNQCYSCVGTPLPVLHIPSVTPEIKTVGPACSDPVRINELDDFKVQCNSSCMKIDIDVALYTVVIRGCHLPSTCKSFTSCKVCSDHLCNSSPLPHPYLLITLASVLVHFIHCKW